MSSTKNLKSPAPHRCALHTLFFVISLITFSGYGLASEPCVAVSVPNPSSKNGLTVPVPVNVTEMSGLGARSADFTVTYNDAVLTFSEATLGSVGTSNSGGRVLTVNSATSGTVTISVFGSSELQGSGTLVNLSFNVIGLPTTSSSVSFSSFTFNEGTPCDTTTNGSVSVVSGTISGKVTYGNALGSPAPPRAVPGVTLNADGTIDRSAVTGNNGAYSLNGMGTGAYTVTPSKSGDVQGSITGFDASDVAVHVVGLAPQLTGNRALVADVSGNGTISSFDAAMIASFVVGLADTGVTGQWKFISEDLDYNHVNIDYTDQNYVALLMGDVSGNWDHPLGEPNLTFEIEGDPLKIAAPSVSASSGSTLTVPVRIGDTTGRGIRSYDFELHYDADVLEPAAVAASVAGTISSGRVLTANANEKGILKVVIFGAFPLEGEGELLNLHFNVIGGAHSSSVLVWDRIQLNEGGINFKADNGEVNVAAAAESASLNGRLLDPRGGGVGRARVIVTDVLGNRREVTTSSLGYFQMSDLRVGETYTVRAESRRYRFAARSVSINDGNAVELTMIGLE